MLVQVTAKPADSQLWSIVREGDCTNRTFGSLVVYVDDFLLSAESDSIAEGLLGYLRSFWTLKKEQKLSLDAPLPDAPEIVVAASPVEETLSKDEQNELLSDLS